MQSIKERWEEYKPTVKKITPWLALVSLALTLLGCVSSFYYYSLDYDYISREEFYKLVFKVPGDIRQWISILLTVAPAALLVLYVFKLQNSPKGKIMLPLFFATYAFRLLYTVCYSFTYGYFDVGYDFYWVDHFGTWSVSLAAHAILLIALIAAAVSARKAAGKKTVPVIAAAIGLLLYLPDIIVWMQNIDWYLEEELYLPIFTWPFQILGVALFFGALILHLPSHGPKAYIPQQKTVYLPPEQALKLLKEKLELGIITEEEYQAQRAGIIESL